MTVFDKLALKERGSEAGVTLQAPGEPEKRYRLRTAAWGEDEPKHPPFALALGGKQKTAEVDFGVLRLGGGVLTLGRFPNLHAPCIVDYIRLVPLAAADQAKWRQQEGCQPILPLSGLADIPDITVLPDGDTSRSPSGSGPATASSTALTCTPGSRKACATRSSPRVTYRAICRRKFNRSIKHERCGTSTNGHAKW